MTKRRGFSASRASALDVHLDVLQTLSSASAALDQWIAFCTGIRLIEGTRGSAERLKAPSSGLEAPDAKEVEEALRSYAQKFGESRDGEVQGKLWALKNPKKEKRQAKLWDVDSEGEQITLCVPEVLPDAAPVFEKSTEDGTAYRIYRLGSIEVRTMQEPQRSENISAMFSMRPTTWTAKRGSKEAGVTASWSEKF
eukprot:Skav229192  [mRNA]  locus=scaffold1004:438636:456595:- [translate_table: standard]